MRMGVLGRVAGSLGMPGRASRFAAKIREALMNEPDWNADIRIKVEAYIREKDKRNEFSKKH